MDGARKRCSVCFVFVGGYGTNHATKDVRLFAQTRRKVSFGDLNPATLLSTLYHVDPASRAIETTRKPRL